MRQALLLFDQDRHPSSEEMKRELSMIEYDTIKRIKDEKPHESFRNL